MTGGIGKGALTAPQSRRAAFFDLRGGTGDSVDPARAAMYRHRAEGDLVVLLLPILDAESQDGYRGAAADVVLYYSPGPGAPNSRLAIVVGLMATMELSASRCFGYGDHPASAGMLCAVGNPRVLGHDPEMRKVAKDRGWPTIEAPSSANS
ncbi:MULTISPECIES: hypothetical protein [unclassified Kitasatospora]|uniref:hypothetical protein n=1 Tax=unclassified Kitasatospora TaxID=2633591 RepID=UPI0012F7D643|nr:MULTISPECIES: hypothetical protein [unclassified Kitasatospora]